MRYLEVIVTRSADERNRMHQFVVREDAYSVSRLLHRERYAPDEHAMVFHVEGPRDPYESKLADGERVHDYAISDCTDESFYLYVRTVLSGNDRTFADAFSTPGLVVVPPVEYRADGTVRLTAVGPAAAVQSAVDGIPDGMGVTVRSVGGFDAGRLDCSTGTAGELLHRAKRTVMADLVAGGPV